jgi:AcrR family transcriptional regulator
MMMKSPRRQDLIDTAIALFSENGFHATGIEMILSKAGMSKKTLYTYFRSKDELVLAALRHYDGLFRNDFMARVEKASPSAEGRLLAIFAIAEEWFSQKDFFGCIFISAASEYSDRSSAIRQTSYEFKRLMRLFVRGLCTQLGVPNPDELADELSLLFEGATVTAQISGSPEAARVAGKMAKRLIADAMAQQTKVPDSSDMAANL